MLTVKKKFVSRVKYIFFVLYIYFTRFTEGHGKRSINRTSCFNGEAVLSLAVRCNKVESSCKIYAYMRVGSRMKTLSLSSVCLLEMHPTSLTDAVRVNAPRHLWQDSV